VHHQAGIRATNESTQRCVALSEKLRDHLIHRRAHLALKFLRPARTLVAWIQIKTPRERPVRFGQAPPNFRQLRGRDRTRFRILTPGPRDASAVRSSLRRKQHMSEMRSEQMPELMDGMISNPVKRGLAFDFSSGTAGDRSSTHRRN
jgi:hypothetical protein